MFAWAISQTKTVTVCVYVYADIRSCVSIVFVGWLVA